jgi:thiamine pyrophosphate-dependent acetolactate synthase large subunit-like protein
VVRASQAVRAPAPDASLVKERAARWSDAHAKLEATYREREGKAAKSEGLSALRVCATLADMLPKNAIYVDETTTHRGLNQRHIGYEGPQSCYRVHGGLGQGVGVALGIKLAAPDRMVVPVLGDGALMYSPLTQCLGCSKRTRSCRCSSSCSTTAATAA